MACKGKWEKCVICWSSSLSITRQNDVFSEWQRCCKISLIHHSCNFDYSAQSHMAEACPFVYTRTFSWCCWLQCKQSHVFVRIHRLKTMDVAPTASELKSALLQPCDSRLIERVKSLSQLSCRGVDKQRKIRRQLGVRCSAYRSWFMSWLCILPYSELWGEAESLLIWSSSVWCWYESKNQYLTSDWVVTLLTL